VTAAPPAQHRLRLPLALVCVLLIALAGMLFLGMIGIDALEGRNDFQFFADSPTYHEAARGRLEQLSTAADLVGVAANFLGPRVLLALAAGDYYAMVAINAVLLAYALASIARTLRIDAPRFLLVLLLNPITLSSVLAVNKEIISLVVLALLLRGLAARSAPYLLLAIGMSILVRWQLTLALVTAVLLVSPLNPLRRMRLLTLLALLLALSVAYVALAPALEPIRLNFEFGAEEYEGSGIFERLVRWQEAGIYWLAFVPKAAHLLWGMGLRLDRLVAPVNIYNDVWQLLHSLALLVMFLALWHARRVRLSNDLVYLSLLYVAVFAITPIYTPRYFYPVYVLWAAAWLARDPGCLRLPLRYTAQSAKSRLRGAAATPAIERPPHLVLPRC
jgi:hypothetical protein